MNKLRVFQNVKKRDQTHQMGVPYEKRTASGFKGINPGTVLLFFFFLPYIITSLFGNSKKELADERLMILEQLKEGRYTVINETAMGREGISLEIYVADKLMRTMGTSSIEGGYEAEALKAQAVLIRTNLITSGDMSVNILDEEYGKKEIPKEYLIAAAQTRGIYLKYDGKNVYGAYCRVSNGVTRSAEEVLQSTEFPYLSSVVCDRDFLSEEYTSTTVLKQKEFDKILGQIQEISLDDNLVRQAEEDGRYEDKENFALIRDSAGYVLFFRYQDKWVSGEEMRYALDLASSSFQIEEEEGKVVFACTGTGHGLGMSQFGANQMALAGKNYVEIIEYYFRGITWSKIE